VALDLMKEKGTALDRQVFTWRDMVRQPISKLDNDAFTRLRVMLMNGVESEAIRFQHMAARMNDELREPLARVRRIEQHQRTLVAWLLPPDLSAIETTVAHKQVAIELTASIAEREADRCLAQVYRYALLEHVDHLYRYAALLDRLEGKDANNILQSYTDIVPGRPTSVQHRHPCDDLRSPYDRKAAALRSRLHALTLVANEHQIREHCLATGPQLADPVARQLYAEIASVEEQHATQYETLIDAGETWLEAWLVHELTEVYGYYSCYLQEEDVAARDVWERFLGYELGHLHLAMDLFQRIEKRDPAEIVPAHLPDPLEFTSHRDFVRDVLSREVDLRASGAKIVPLAEEPERSRRYRDQLNAHGSPSETVATGYRWAPGTELSQADGDFRQSAKLEVEEGGSA
jgi:hypothetical protein